MSAPNQTQLQEIIAALMLNLQPPLPATQTGVYLVDNQVVVPDTAYNQGLGASNIQINYDGVNFYLSMSGFY